MLLVAGCVLLGAFWISTARASDLGETPDTARLLDRIEETRLALTPADLQAAHRLNADGDRAYRRKDYRAAFTAYANSYPNAPNAYAYIMAGEAHWRAVVQQARESSAPAPGPSCRLDNSHFAHDLATDLAQHWAVGLALAARDNARPFLASRLYRRARESTACLHALAQRYEAEPPTSCVDLQRLERCLGAPLIE